MEWDGTPAKGTDLRDLSSPLKVKSSSPPQDHHGNIVSARELGSPIKERLFGALQSREGSAAEEDPLAPPPPEMSAGEQDDDGVDDLQGVDLTKGFEKIGKWHAELNGTLKIHRGKDMTGIWGGN